MNENAEDRLTRIESLLSHLQHDVDQLNEALVTQQAQIDALTQSLRKLESTVDALPDAPVDPQAERPPHY